MAFLLVMALAAPFILKDPQGRPLISFRDVQKTSGGFSRSIEETHMLLSKSIKSIFKSNDDLPENSKLQSGAESFQVHYWKDENGVLHFSDEKNLIGDSKLKTITNDATFVDMNSKELLEKLEQIYNSSPLDDNANSGEGFKLPDLASGSFSLQDMLSTFDKAKEVQSVVDARHDIQSKAVDAL